FGSRYDITVHQCLESLLASDAIGAVCITVPNHLHADYVYAAADAGKAVFVEKPLASSPSLCRELGQYCADKGVILQVGHQMRLEPVFRAMKRKLNTGDLGAPIYAHGVYTLPRQIRNDWRNQPELCPGGSMEQVGIHLVDVLMCLFGTPAASQGWSRNI